MGGGLRKDEAEQAYPLFIKIAGGKKKPLTAESIQAYWPSATPAGIKMLIHKCKGSSKHPAVNKYGYDAFLQSGVLYAWGQFNPYDDVQEVDYETFRDGLRVIRQGSDEEIEKIANFVCSEMDKGKKGKVTLADFIEYTMKCYAHEEKPWAFIDDEEFVAKHRSGGGKKKKKKGEE